MLKVKPHTAALLFLGIIAVPLLFIVLLQGLQLYVRHQLEERLEKEAAVSLALSAGELVWVEPGKEILVEGQLFDIKTIRYEGGKALVTGIFDQQETDILDLLQQQGASSQKTHSVEQLFVWLLQFVTNSTNLSFFLGSKAGQTFALFTLAHYTNPILDLIVPPPQG